MSESNQSMKIKIVKKNKQWHGRLITANGQIVWWTENYKDKRDVAKSVELLKTVDLNSTEEIDESVA